MDESLIIVCPHCNSPNRVPHSKPTAAAKCGKCGKELFNAHSVDLKGVNFNQHINRNTIPVIVDFWSPQCGPCNMMNPIYEQAAQQFEPKIRFAKVDTDQEQMIASAYKIRGTPTFIIFRNGNETDRKSGAMDMKSFVNWVRGALRS